jgi:hypothetical protein
LQIVAQKKTVTGFNKKINALLPNLTIATKTKAFDFKPMASKKIIGVLNPVFIDKAIPLLNLNQLNVDAIHRGITLPASLAMHSLSIDKPTLSLTDRLRTGNKINLDKTKYQQNQNIFHLPLEKDTFHEVNFTVPNLGLKAKEMAVYNIEMRNPETNAVIGGITLVVTG